MIRKIFAENPNQKEIDQTIRILQQGGIVILPTDTTYAFACDLMQPKSIEKLAKLKKINPSKANFSIICQDLSNLSQYTKPLDNWVFKLMKHNLPGPFTFILTANNKVPKMFLNNKKTIGIRVPDNAIILEIVRQLQNPIVATSIHDPDEIIEYTTDPELIHERYEDEVDMVIDGGYGHNEVSTIVDCTGHEPVIIREGLGILQF